MDKQQRERLITITQEAVPAIKLVFEPLVNCLLSRGVLTADMVDALSEYSPPARKGRELHIQMTRRGKGAYEAYYEALMECGVTDIASLMEDLIDTTKITQPLPVVSGGSGDDLPEVWPPPGYDPLSTTIRTINPRSLELHMKKYVKAIPNRVYPLPRGYVLIINNRDFGDVRSIHGTVLSDRLGTNHDATIMDKTMSEIGFYVDCRDNRSANEVFEDAKEAVSDERSKSCFMCVILSHGASGGFYGIRGNFVTFDDLIDIVKDRLPNTPKIFFIQACQGVNKDKGVTNVEREQDPLTITSQLPNISLSAGDGKTITAENFSREFQDLRNSTGVNKNISAQNFQSEFLSLAEADEHLQSLYLASVKNLFHHMSLSDESDASGFSTRPQYSDIYTAIATVDGFVAWRNGRGSWFIQALIYVIKNWAHSDNLDQLLTKVTNLVSQQEHNLFNYKQVCLKNSTFTKDFYFFPGLTERDIQDIQRS